MSKTFFKYILPLVVIIVGSWMIDLIGSLTDNTVLIIVVQALFMFVFGISIQPKRRYKTWLKKLIIAFIFSYLVFYQLGYFQYFFITKLFTMFAIDKLALNLIYVLLGWLFFD